MLLREHPPSPPDAPADGRGDGPGGTASDHNPFAPPPEGAPDRPWQPRYPAGGSPREDSSGGPSDGSDGPGQGGRSPWGGRWSDRQPDRSSGGFGERPQRPGGGTQGPGMRWDPTDPVQRRARYALLAGMWAFFFALFSWTYVALLLGALALYWGISSLRAKPRGHDAGTPAPTGRPQATAAISGLVTASLALAVVATSFAAQLVYRDYYTCVNDSLTQQAKQSCDRHLPPELRGVLGDNR